MSFILEPGFWDAFSEVAIPVLGVSAIILVARNNRWGFILGLVSQPFWLVTTLLHHQWGVFVTAIAYALSWAYGIYIKFLKQKPTRTVFDTATAHEYGIKRRIMNTVPDDPSHRERMVFLLRVDFAEAFQQLRFYDDQSLKVFQVTIGAQISLVTAAGALYVAFVHEPAMLLVLSVLLFLGSLAGALSLVFLVRNRIFFVIMARYINQFRSFIHAAHPLGFEDKTGIWSSIDYPPFFEWHATHMILMYGNALFNSFLIAAAIDLVVFWLWHPHKLLLLVAGAATSLFTWGLQTILVIKVIHGRQGKTAEGNPLQLENQAP